MTAMADFREDWADGQRILRFSGRLTLAQIKDLPKRLGRIDPPARIDLTELERIDTVGAWVVYKLATENGAKIEGASREAARLIEQVAKSGLQVQVRPEPLNPFIRVLGEIGDAVFEAFATLKGLLGFFGAILIGFWNILLNPRRFRFHALVHRLDLVGIRALAIIGLMSFLIGTVIAQQGADQLAEFGAEGLTVAMVGRLSARELGILMTAIMVAGRSGSAFAAQIGTMKLTEEIDAMRTIGISPIEALVIPRLLAAVIMLPLLGFYATMMSIVGGGLFCWAYLGIAPVSYVQQLQTAVPVTDMLIGLIKAPVFGTIIALTGCYQGMKVEGNAEEVGLKTTAAVVQAIFLVIVLDAVFAVLFSSIGWK